MAIFYYLFWLVVFGLGLGVFISVFILLPLFIYAIPYCFWVGGQNCAGRQLDKKKEKFLSTIKNASRLYKCWLTGRKPTL